MREVSDPAFFPPSGHDNSFFQKTRAHRRLVDDVPHDVKHRRLDDVQSTFRETALELNQRLIGSVQVVLVEKVRITNCAGWAHSVTESF